MIWEDIEKLHVIRGCANLLLQFHRNTIIPCEVRGKLSQVHDLIVSVSNDLEPIRGRTEHKPADAGEEK